MFFWDHPKEGGKEHKASSEGELISWLGVLSLTWERRDCEMSAPFVTSQCADC